MSLRKTLSPRVTGIQIKSCHKTVKAGSHHAPLLLDNCHRPFLPQLLHPSSLPVAPVFPPSFHPPPSPGVYPSSGNTALDMFQGVFRQRMGNEEGSVGSWEGNVTKGKESVSCQNRGKYGVILKQCKLFIFIQ